MTMRHMVIGRCAKYLALKLLNLNDFEIGLPSSEDKQSDFIQRCMAMQVHLDNKIANMDEHAQRTFYMTKVRPWYLADGRV
ncbi:hypothetical protein, partial [Vibrio vulnificus]|uniref:hypothetical protein n=1 Tax=Vibrio vulnificus TaxID=672 RepID=UPI0039B4BAB2